jgi:hypothetical protein
MIPIRQKLPPLTNPTMITAKNRARDDNDMKNISTYEASSRNVYIKNRAYGDTYNLNNERKIPVKKHPSTSNIWNALWLF